LFLTGIERRLQNIKNAKLHKEVQPHDTSLDFNQLTLVRSNYLIVQNSIEGVNAYYSWEFNELVTHHWQWTTRHLYHAMKCYTMVLSQR
jgi:hypothetical protein